MMEAILATLRELAKDESSTLNGLDDETLRAMAVTAQLAAENGGAVVLPPPPGEFVDIEPGLRNEIIRGVYTAGQNIIRGATRLGNWEKDANAVEAERRGRSMLAAARVLEQYVLAGRSVTGQAMAGAPALGSHDPGLALDQLRQTAADLELAFPALDDASALEEWIGALPAHEQRELETWARYAVLLPPAPVSLRAAPRVDTTSPSIDPEDLAVSAAGVPVDGPALAAAMKSGGLDAAKALSRGETEGTPGDVLGDAPVGDAAATEDAGDDAEA